MQIDFYSFKLVTILRLQETKLKHISGRIYRCIPSERLEEQKYIWKTVKVRLRTLRQYHLKQQFRVNTK